MKYSIDRRSAGRIYLQSRVITIHSVYTILSARCAQFAKYSVSLTSPPPPPCLSSSLDERLPLVRISSAAGNIAFTLALSMFRLSLVKERAEKCAARRRGV